MLPPCSPGGTECGRARPATATPIVPRKGASGNSTTAVAAVRHGKHADEPAAVPRPA